MRWDGYIHNYDGEPVFWVKKLITIRGWTARLHKFVKKDNAGCFHTHPSHAYRFILAGGYVEEIMDLRGNRMSEVRRFSFAHIAPEYCHRIERFLNGRWSLSLWIVGPKVASIQLRGPGWPPAEIEQQAEWNNAKGEEHAGG